MAQKSLNIKGLLQKKWHMDPKSMAYEPPPPLPYAI